MMDMYYWKTLQYIGGGYVLQRRMRYEGGALDNDDNESLSHEFKVNGSWGDKAAIGMGDAMEDVRLPERIIHVKDTDNIDNSNVLRESDFELGE